MCVRIPILLNLNKLHCIIIAMSCILSHEHAGSFSVVVSIASVVCCSDLFFANRMLHGDVSNEKFFRCSSTIFSGEPVSLYPFNTFALASSIF
jgi:hypothetical protein